MAKTTLAQVLEEVKTLSPDEQRQLRDKLDEWLRQERLENRLEWMLCEAGLLSDAKPPRTASASSRRFEPVAVKGAPVSETIIAERR